MSGLKICSYLMPRALRNLNVPIPQQAKLPFTKYETQSLILASLNNCLCQTICLAIGVMYGICMLRLIIMSIIT